MMLEEKIIFFFCFHFTLKKNCLSLSSFDFRILIMKNAKANSILIPSVYYMYSMYVYRRSIYIYIDIFIYVYIYRVRHKCWLYTTHAYILCSYVCTFRLRRVAAILVFCIHIVSHSNLSFKFIMVVFNFHGTFFRCNLTKKLLNYSQWNCAVYFSR